MSRWRRLRRHDPERDAAAYVAGEMRATPRRRFEEHLLECEGCWTEVRAARRGRAVAETVRELARPSLREEVRAAIALSPPSDRARLGRGLVRLAVVGGGVAAIFAGAFFLAWTMMGHPQRQPAAITAALDSFRSDRIPAEGPALQAAPDLAGAGLQLMLSGHGIVGGHPVDVYYFRGPSGARVFVFESAHPFPRAHAARDLPGPGHRWQTHVGEVSMQCGDRPMPYLVLGNRHSTVATASSTLQSATVPQG